MRIYQLDDYKEIFNNEAIVEVMNEVVFNPTIGKIKSIAQSIYSKQQGIFFTIEEDEKIIGIMGFKRLTKNSVEMLHFALLKDYQGKGFGKKAIVEVKNYFTDTTLVLEADFSTIKFFKKCGFKTTRLHDDALDTGMHKCEL